MWIGSDFFLEGRKFCTLLFSLFKQLGILPFPLMRLELSQELKAPQVSLKRSQRRWCCTRHRLTSTPVWGWRHQGRALHPDPCWPHSQLGQHCRSRRLHL